MDSSGFNTDAAVEAVPTEAQLAGAVQDHDDVSAYEMPIKPIVRHLSIKPTLSILQYVIKPILGGQPGRLRARGGQTRHPRCIRPGMQHTIDLHYIN
jgi:hypothetical protein